MKLLLCVKCSDIVSLRTDTVRTCTCGKSGGQYIDSVNAEYWGKDAYLIGIANPSLVQALKDQINEGDKKDGFGREFRAFVIPLSASSIKKLDKCI